MKAHRLSLVDEVARLADVGDRFDLAVGEDFVKITRRCSNSVTHSVPLLTGDD